MRDATGNNRLTLSCSLMDQAALYSETYLNRDRHAGKRPRRVRVTEAQRAVRKPSEVTVIDCRNLDIVLT